MLLQLNNKLQTSESDTMDIETGVALVTSVTSLAAIFIAVYTLRKENVKTGIHIMLDTGEKFFEAEEWLNKRIVVARLMEKMENEFQILMNTEGNETQSETFVRKELARTTDHYSKDIVLNYFEGLAYLVHIRTLDLRYFTSYYAYWIYHYWTFFSHCIDHDRIVDKGCWSNMENVYKKMIRTRGFKKRGIELNHMEFVQYELSCCQKMQNR